MILKFSERARREKLAGQWTLCKIIQNYSKLLTSRGLGAQCSKHATVLLIEQ